MFVCPKSVMFESRRDIIDYVSKSMIPPTKQQVALLTERIKVPMLKDDSKNESLRGQEVIITDDIVPATEEGREVFANTIKDIHKNIFDNFMKSCAAIGGIFIGIIAYNYMNK